MLYLCVMVQNVYLSIYFVLIIQTKRLSTNNRVIINVHCYGFVLSKLKKTNAYLKYFSNCSMYYCTFLVT